MKFGSQTVFDYVRQMVNDPNSEEAYQVLYDIIWQDAAGLLSGCDLPREDKEDIIQNVEMSIFPRLRWYVETFEHASVGQRNACLKTIVTRRLNDLLARKYKHGNVISYDTENFPLELFGAYEDSFASLSGREDLHKVLYLLCSLDYSPEQIIAYLLTRTAGVSAGAVQNGKPAVVAQLLQGKTLQQAARIAFNGVQELCPFPVDAAAYDPLLKKLEEQTPDGLVGERLFDLSPRAISYNCGRIARSLRKCWERMIGGNVL